ncbi:MAG: undecaprenyldiphospho-muramoylpentapeptide beta-N-acetylglucosaminyltransferase [Calditerrivibrio sp.]|nr:undecaprenyldiphospho-muramoylpentapeptide beta-N-acetylglucosaminyltransferase [Calditerrivibrio sp.]
MKIVIAGGGTGGHLYPGIAIAEKLKDMGFEFIFLVSNRGIERRILTELGFNFVEQPETPLKGVSVGKKIKSVGKILGNVMDALNTVSKDDRVILLGGFASFSAGVASIIKRVPVYIHEQNSVMGLSNRIFSRFAEKVFVSFDKTLKAPEGSIVVGNPVRAVFRDIPFKVRPDKNLLLVGGSQGSRFLNNLLVDVVDKLLGMGFSIIHQTGDRLYEETIERYREKGIGVSNVTVKKYIDDMVEAIKWADLVISRAGAGLVFEILYSRRFGVFIPFSEATDNHQYYNAKFIEEKGVGVVLEEKKATGAKLLEIIKHYYDSFELYRDRFEKVFYRDTAEIIIKEMELEHV